MQPDPQREGGHLRPDRPALREAGELQTGGIRFEKGAGRRGRAGPPGGERRRDPKRGRSFCVHGSPVPSSAGGRCGGAVDP